MNFDDILQQCLDVGWEPRDPKNPKNRVNLLSPRPLEKFPLSIAEVLMPCMYWILKNHFILITANSIKD